MILPGKILDNSQRDIAIARLEESSHYRRYREAERYQQVR